MDTAGKLFFYVLVKMKLYNRNFSCSFFFLMHLHLCNIYIFFFDARVNKDTKKN